MEKEKGYVNNLKGNLIRVHLGDKALYCAHVSPRLNIEEEVERNITPLYSNTICIHSPISGKNKRSKVCSKCGQQLIWCICNTY